MSMKLRTLRAGLTLFWMSAISLSAPAATDEERATARSLANQAITAFKEKRYSNAADLFQRAESLVHSPVHLLYLGRAYSATGNLLRAQEAYLKATRESISPTSPPAFSKAVDDANSELETLRPRLGQLLVNISGLSRGEVAEVLVDGEQIPPAMVGVLVPLDPGQHRVEAKAARHLPSWRRFSLAEGQTEKITLTLEEDPDAPQASAGQPATPPGSGTDGTETDTPKPPAKVESSGGNPVFLYTSLGGLAIGVAGTALGLYHVVRYSKYFSESDRLFNSCPRTVEGEDNCSDEEKAAIGNAENRAGTEQRLMIPPFVVGGVGLVLGTTLLVLYANSADTKTATSGVHVVPWLGVNSLGVRGTF